MSKINYKSRSRLLQSSTALDVRFNHALMVIMAGSMLSIPSAFAEENTGAETARDNAETIEEITITGSRRPGRSASDVPVPVDIISAESMRDQGGVDITNLLRTSVPSLNVNDNPLSGTSTSVRPASMRGLSPDHVLILVNGKRRHRAADIPTFSGGISDGSQGPDLSSIPAIAMKQLQVLRDGAAAQYGSDAIAGVMNFIMNDSPEGGTIEVKLGSTYAGDGDTYQVAATYGMPIGDSGFVRFSAEFRESDLTDRAIQRGDAQALIDAGNTDVPTPASRFGTPQIDDDLKLFVNMAAEAGENSEFYFFGGYSERKTASDFFYRNPTGRFGVFTDDDDGGNYLIGDMTPNDGITCDGGIDFGGTGVVNTPIAVGSAGADARLAAVFADPNCYSALETYPGGYTPFFGSKLTDMSGTTGLRGELENGLIYDVSLSGGRNQLAFNVDNVPNPSLGSLSPTNFKDVGRRVQTETNVNVDLSYPVEVAGLASPLNVAGGFEWHKEKFSVVAGAPESYEAGILANQGFLIGEEAFPGFSPSIAGDFARRNIAFYLDLEADVTDELVLGAAIRYEDFTDMGSKVTWKVTGLYHITDDLAMRSSYATGFHAPTPGQQNFSALTTEISPGGDLIESGVIPATSPVAMAVGGKQLEPETSNSFSIGFAYSSDLIDITVDYYRITMENRLTQSASQSLTAGQKADLIAEGFFAAAGLGSFRFFTNDFSSKTQGIDVVATVPLDIVESGQTELVLAGNWTETKVTSFDPTDPNELLSQGRVIQLEENNPKFKGNLTLKHGADNWRAHVRANYYSSFTELHVNALGPRIDSGAQITIDVQAAYEVTDQIELVVGADNVFNNFPDANPWDFILGSKYPTTSPGGINGGFYYAKVRFNF
ncbi:MAG: TonB-dependent receptor [Emcibacter sp.]|nr:TonB-dependent receptor [Emcibacter sp.]